MNNQLTEQPIQTPALASTTDMVLNHQAMAQMNNLAQLMASGSATVPKHLQGNPADCMAIVMQAAQWQMNPYAVAQKTHLVSGTLGYEAQLVNAVISSSRAIVGRFHYRYGGGWQVSGDGVGVNASIQKGVNVNIGTTITADSWVQVGAVLAGETEIQWGEPLYPANVTTKNSALWKTAPKQQAAYLATKYWARLYAPAVIMGVYSTDELAPINAPHNVVDITPAEQPQTQSSALNNILSQSDEPAPDSSLGTQATIYIDKIAECQTVGELQGVQSHIKNAVAESAITDAERNTLIDAFAVRRREILAADADTATGEIVGE